MASDKAIDRFLTKMRVAQFTDRQIREEIAILREILLERQQQRATKRYLRKQAPATNQEGERNGKKEIHRRSP